MVLRKWNSADLAAHDRCTKAECGLREVKILQRNANLDGTSVTVGPPPEQVPSLE